MGKIVQKSFVGGHVTNVRGHVTNVINFEEKKTLPLTKKRLKLRQNATSCYIYGKRFSKNFARNKNYQKVRDHCNFTSKYIGVAHSICNLRFNVSNGIPVVFHNGSNCNYHFIIKGLANEFVGQFESLG